MSGALRLVCACACVAAMALLAPAARAQDDGPQVRVIGGETATVSQYPWQAAIASTGSGSAYQRQFCGGSLIAARIVITAAHCVDGEAPAEVSVILGRTRLSSAEGTEHPVVDVAIHPGYVSRTVENDVGYLVLAAPSAQEPIDIAGADESAVWAPGRATEASGWGATGSGYPDHLMAAVVPVIADDACAAPAVYGHDFRAASMVCAGHLAGGVDTCWGDSGGPLQAPLEGGGYRLVGLTSWGDGCADPNAPGVYTRVAGGGLRDEIASQLLALEQEHGLAHESVIGSGGQPRTSGPAPPIGGGTGGQGAAVSGAQPAVGEQDVPEQATRPFKRCKKLKSKRKRMRCIRKVKRKLG